MSTGRPGGLWARWKALLARQETGEALAVFRVFVGFCALWAVAVPMQYGVAEFMWADTGYRGEGMDADTLRWVLRLGVVSSVSLILGLGGRVSAFVTLQVCIAFMTLHPAASGAHDRLIKNALWLLVLANSTATLSLDCRLKTGAWTSDRLVSAWPRYLAVLQLFIMYQATGIQKISPEWTPLGGFSALWYIVRSDMWMRFDADWLPYWFTQFSTAGTWIWEWCAWVFLYALWCRDKRPATHWANRYDLRTLWAAWGIGMHMILYVLTVLGPLSWATLAWYACLWHPDEYRAGWRRLAGRLRPSVDPASG